MVIVMRCMYAYLCICTYFHMRVCLPAHLHVCAQVCVSVCVSIPILPIITRPRIAPSQVADLSMGDLLLHTSVAWINPPASLGKWKKEPQLATFGTSKTGTHTHTHTHTRTRTRTRTHTHLFSASRVSAPRVLLSGIQARSVDLCWEVAVYFPQRRR